MAEDVQLLFTEGFVSFADQLRVQLAQQVVALAAFCFDVVEDVQALEGVVPEEHVVENDSDSPDVNAFVVGLVCQDLRRHEVGSAAVGFGSLAQFFGESKVSYFADVRLLFGYFFKQYVFALEIPMNDVFLVDGPESPQDLHEDGAGFLQFEHLVSHAILVGVEVAVLAVLHDQEDGF